MNYYSLSIGHVSGFIWVVKQKETHLHSALLAPE